MPDAGALHKNTKATIMPRHLEGGVGGAVSLYARGPDGQEDRLALGPHDYPRSGGEPTAELSLGAPIVVLLSLGLWAVIWAGFSLFLGCALQ
jgi:hypothetical protein